MSTLVHPHLQEYYPTMSQPFPHNDQITTETVVYGTTKDNQPDLQTAYLGHGEPQIHSSISYKCPP
jgi:hypothetical protein